MPSALELPFLGNALELIPSQGWSLQQHYERYGSVFKLRLLGKNWAVLVGPEANQLILQERADHVSSYLGWQPFMENVFGRPMMLQDGEEHRRTRRLMAPAFHGRAIASYFDTMQSIIQTYLKCWQQQDEIRLKSELNQMALRVGVQLLFGIEASSDLEKVEGWYNTLVQGTVALLRVDLPFTTYGRSQRVRRYLKTYLRNIIKQRQLQGRLQESRDVLGLFLASIDQEGNALTTEQVIDELIHLLNGAHFTTSTALTWAMFELSAHPEWRVRLQEELVQITDGKPLVLEHLKQLSQMTNFLKEIERMYNPSGVAVFRGVVKSLEYGGYRIPVGWNVIVAQAITHYLPEIYSHPQQFDPDRFASPREEDKKYPYSLIGFGGGEHVCIGMEFGKMQMKLFLSELLRQHEFEIIPPYSQLAPIDVPPKVEGRLRATIRAV
jgi:cytochrome P450